MQNGQQVGECHLTAGPTAGKRDVARSAVLPRHGRRLVTCPIQKRVIGTIEHDGTDTTMGHPALKHPSLQLLTRQWTLSIGPFIEK